MLAASSLNMRSVKIVYSSLRTLYSERIVLPNAFFKIFLIALLGFEQDSKAKGISGRLKLSSEKLSTGEKQLHLLLTVTMESGMYLEFKSLTDCKLYGSKGNFIEDVQVQGKIPTLKSGENQVSFGAEPNRGVKPRVQLTIITEGKALLN